MYRIILGDVSFFMKTSLRNSRMPNDGRMGLLPRNFFRINSIHSDMRVTPRRIAVRQRPPVLRRASESSMKEAPLNYWEMNRQVKTLDQRAKRLANHKEIWGSIGILLIIGGVMGMTIFQEFWKGLPESFANTLDRLLTILTLGAFGFSAILGQKQEMVEIHRDNLHSMIPWDERR